MHQALKSAGFALLLLAGPAVAGPVGLLVYQVREPGLPPYFSRMLVTPDYVRLDEGGDPADGYTLFERGSGAIYNVSSEDRSVTVMQANQDIPPSPVKLELTEKVSEDRDAPMVGGKTPVRVLLYANGQQCRDLVSVDGVMVDAVQGLKELRASLARIQGSRLSVWTEQSRTPCDLAELIYAPLRGLQYGLPVMDRSLTLEQTLLDFKPDYEADPELFVIPDDYQRFSIPGL